MRKFIWIAAICSFLFAGAVGAQEVSFPDAQGDDNGPGNYTYPTDTAYIPGSFDLTGFKAKMSGDQATFEISVAAKLEDPWGMRTGFAVQTVYIYIDQDHKEGSGFTKGLPGQNIQFAPADAWEKCVILSPQSAARVKQEVDSKAKDVAAGVLIPKTVKGTGSKIIGSVPMSELSQGDPNTWGFQVVMQSNEGFPAATDLLSRKVNEYEGQHRFGGGNDGECDPHVLDVLGDDQKEQLTYECNADGTSKKVATVHMVRKS